MTGAAIEWLQGLQLRVVGSFNSANKWRFKGLGSAYRDLKRELRAQRARRWIHTEGRCNHRSVTTTDLDVWTIVYRRSARKGATYGSTNRTRSGLESYRLESGDTAKVVDRVRICDTVCVEAIQHRSEATDPVRFTIAHKCCIVSSRGPLTVPVAACFVDGSGTDMKGGLSSVSASCVSGA